MSGDFDMESMKEAILKIDPEIAKERTSYFCPGVRNGRGGYNLSCYFCHPIRRFLKSYKRAIALFLLKREMKKILGRMSSKEKVLLSTMLVVGDILQKIADGDIGDISNGDLLFGAPPWTHHTGDNEPSIH